MKELLSELFDQHYKDVYMYLLSLCHDASLAEDLTSEVFLELVKSIATFRGESDIKTWLFSIARHRWYAYLRRKSRQVETESMELLYDRGLEDMGQSDENKDLSSVIESFLKSELTRKIFYMRLEGWSYYEIGKAVNIAENSARVAFFRVKAKMKKYLEKEGYGNE